MEPGNANGEIMTLTEVAEYLQLAERTVLRMAQRGDIPAAKVASQWRFMRSLIREWLVGQMQAFPAQAITPSGDLKDPLLPLREILHPELAEICPVVVPAHSRGPELVLRDKFFKAFHHFGIITNHINK